MDRMNYHHLRYFREVAVDGQLARTAQRLNVSQSALSMQIKALEESLGTDLFERVSRKLVLTHAGRVALDYADQIFSAGAQLLETFKSDETLMPPLRVGAVSTLSRNFQLQFLRPLFTTEDAVFSLRSAGMQTLMADLKALRLDVVLATTVPEPDEAVSFAVQKVSEQSVGLHGQSAHLTHATLSDLLTHEAVILPSDPIIRTGFDGLVARLGIAPRIAAHVDDMAMVRLLAREGVGLAVAPSVVLADELRNGTLATAPFDLGISESFFAVTLARQFRHPTLDRLL
ncbi:MAG: LysR family transcriptional regulator [Pseudomonadota bacterium]